MARQFRTLEGSILPAPHTPSKIAAELMPRGASTPLRIKQPGDHAHQYKQPSTELTRRENQFLNLLIDECAANRDIARAMNISEETVKRHLSNIFDKTGYSTRLELAVRTMQKRDCPECARRKVEAEQPGAIEREIYASGNLEAEFQIVDAERCLARSAQSFAAAWIAASRDLR